MIYTMYMKDVDLGALGVHKVLATGNDEDITKLLICDDSKYGFEKLLEITAMVPYLTEEFWDVYNDALYESIKEREMEAKNPECL